MYSFSRAYLFSIDIYGLITKSKYGAEPRKVHQIRKLSRLFFIEECYLVELSKFNNILGEIPLSGVVGRVRVYKFYFYLCWVGMLSSPGSKMYTVRSHKWDLK